jgi:RNA polymerase subunit RPABC4/transcription elongation factor Spt4
LEGTLVLDPTILSNLAYLGTAFGAGFLAALWLALIIWTYRDIRRRTRDVLARILAMLIVFVLYLPGLVIYLILRPATTLEQEYQQALEEEALLQTIEEPLSCPGCGRKVKEEWQICPSCHTRLKKSCHQCSKLMDLPWNVCPYCGNPEPGVRIENLTLEDAMRSLDESAPAVEEENKSGSQDL